MLKTTWRECLTCLWPMGFLERRTLVVPVSLVLVIRERRHKMTWPCWFREKERNFPGSQREQRSSSINSGTTESRSGATTSQIEALPKEVAQARQERSQPVPERPPLGESQSNGITERAVVVVAGQARTLKAALEHYLITSAGTERHPLQRQHGRRDNTPILEFGEKILYVPAKPARGGKWEPRFCPRVYVGMLNSSSEAVVVTEQGLAIKTRSANIRRVPESERWDADSILQMRATPWSPDGSDKAFDIQVGMERPAEMVPRDPGEALMENKVSRTYLRRADFEQWDLSEGCPGCRYLRTGQVRQQAHSKACRKRIEGLLKGDSMGAARLAAAHERINRALADAVERHAAEDPGVRGILKRASVVCHPESESQKKIALDTEHESTPRPSVSYGESSESDTRPSTATRTAQDADTSDVTRGTGPELAQGVIQPNNSDDTGDDVAMEGDSVDENSAGHSNPSGSDSRRDHDKERTPGSK